ncbi:6,7-dimethyl-8-ribityllumazine synthase [Chelativorans sp. M5D2P16]|uniref:6,7-dimethyl-8-ribityllumazine synthase n=1 Tax=Chelativorans sp. M5D2P16 TaxID=3095678 RepID=UPI002ACA9C27|nr:6,7-dimethyl-8-ribityllumazine synthase [Chelativorans sp. M5D2P16]MDZ5696886.1 6,7-dimethyl-8-ribityllumazine synthase [Chelativorans sp. M5D2P16]
MATKRPRILIVEARFYDHLADGLLKGAKLALDEAGAAYEVVTVPGSLEIPAVVAYAVEAAKKGAEAYDGFVALGCVIRGQTYHFEIVSNESSRALMDLAVRHGLAVGNGILTVESEAQALVRIEKGEGSHPGGGKGYAAARAALDLIGIRERLGA